MFFKIGVFRNFAIFTGRHQSLFLRKLQTLRPYGLQLYLKETLTQLFSCEYWKIFTNSVFCTTPPVGLTIKPGTPEHGTPAEQRNSGTPRNSGGTTEHYPEHQRNTPVQRNHTKRRTIVGFLRENLKLKI